MKGRFKATHLSVSKYQLFRPEMEIGKDNLIWARHAPGTTRQKAADFL